MDRICELYGLVGTFGSTHNIIFIPALEIFQDRLLRADFGRQFSGGSGRLQRLLTHFFEAINGLLYGLL